MGRILAIDYGKKRVGIATTDPLKMIANGLTTIHTTGIWKFLEDYLSKEDVEGIVVGYPKQMNNQPSESLIYVNQFVKRFQIKYPAIYVELMDERFTSKMAFQTMIDGGLGKKKRQDKALVDTISATIILQSFLETKSNLR